MIEDRTSKTHSVTSIHVGKKRKKGERRKGEEN